MSSLYFKEFSPNKSTLVCTSTTPIGWLSNSSTIIERIPLRSVVFSTEINLTDSDLSKIKKTTESKELLVQLQTVLTKANDLPALAENASDDDKVAREAILKKNKEEVETILSKLEANKDASNEANKYIVDAKSMIADIKAHKPTDILYNDKPVVSVHKFVLTNKHEVVVKFTDKKDVDFMLQRF